LRVLYAVSAGLILTLWSLAASSQGLSGLVAQSAEFLPVEEAYQLEVETVSPQELRLYWQIADDYYLYQHRFKATLEDEQGDVNVDWVFSPGIDKTDEFFGEVTVYYGSADLRLVAQRPFGKARLSVTSQGCADAGLCYPPYTEQRIIDPETGRVAPDSDSTPTPAVAEPVSQPSASSGASENQTTLWLAVLFAFLVGVILNAMPCVFPILSLKVLSFA